MRIIAGTFRGRNLKSPPSLAVRPTSDRLRETLFNILAPRIKDSRFLDLCAGSGAVGIEALSRGAVHVTLVDDSREMCSLIKSNLDLCHVERSASAVIQSTAHDYLRHFLAKRPDTGQPWDIVFFDPPYASDYAPVLKLFGKQSFQLFNELGLLIVEHHKKTELPGSLGSMIRTRVLKQGDSALSFYSQEQILPAEEVSQ